MYTPKLIYTMTMIITTLIVYHTKFTEGIRFPLSYGSGSYTPYLYSSSSTSSDTSIPINWSEQNWLNTIHFSKFINDNVIYQRIIQLIRSLPQPYTSKSMQSKKGINKSTLKMIKFLSFIQHHSHFPQLHQNHFNTTFACIIH